MTEQYYHPELLRFAFVLGIVVSLAFYDRRHLTTGGIAVPGYLAFSVFQPLILPAILLSAVVAHLVVRRLIARRFLLSDSMVFSMTVVASAFIHVGLDQALVAAEAVGPSSPLMRGIGYIVPGLIAHDFDRHGYRRTLVNTGCATALVSCAILGASLADPSLVRLADSPVQDVFPIGLAELPVLIVMGVLAWLGVVRRHGLRCGGFVGSAYVALLLLQPVELLRIIAIAGLTFGLVQVLKRGAILFGRRLFGAHLTIGALLAWASFRLSELHGNADTIAVVTPSLSIVAMLVTGLLSHDVERAGLVRTAFGTVVSAALALSGTLVVVEAMGPARPLILSSWGALAGVIVLFLSVPHGRYVDVVRPIRRSLFA